jgi:4-amino-4-deoxy-L-arabinose transferase-like glycosyltransferase
MPSHRSTPASISESSLFFPEKSPAERRVAVLVFLLSLAYLCLFRRYTQIEPDEGIILQGAQRILQGEVLYRDFFSFFTPGSYYLPALLFKIFGSSMLVARTALALYGSILAVVSFLLARRVCGRSVALAAAALVTLTSLPYRFLVLHNWDSTLWAALALYGAVRWLESDARQAPAWAWAFATGTFAALTILFEQSKGCGLVLGLAAGVVVIVFAGRCRLSFRQGVALSAGLAWPFLLVFAWFGANHSLGPMLADWLWPLHHYSAVNRVPYGYQNWSDSTRAALFESPSWAYRIVVLLVLIPGFIVPILPLAAAGILVVGGIKALRSRAMNERTAYYVLVSATLSGLLLSVLAGRADVLHFVYLAPLLYLVLAWALEGRDVPFRLFQALLPGLRAFVLASFSFLAVALLAKTLNANVRNTTRRGPVNTASPDAVLSYVQAHVAPGSKILVYPYLPLYNYLTGTFSPSHYEYLMPGMHTPEQFREVAADLARENTPVLYALSFSESIPTSWPNTPLAWIARDPVGDNIQRHYKPCRALDSSSPWRFVFMVPKGSPCPQDPPVR